MIATTKTFTVEELVHRKEFLVDQGISVVIESLEEPLHPHLKSEYHAKKHKLGH